MLLMVSTILIKSVSMYASECVRCHLPPKMLEDVFGVDVELNKGVLLGAARNVLEVDCPKSGLDLGVSAFSSSELRLTGVPSGLVMRPNRLLVAFGSAFGSVSASG